LALKREIIVDGISLFCSGGHGKGPKLERECVSENYIAIVHNTLRNR
jgi:hypothetical protein